MGKKLDLLEQIHNELFRIRRVLEDNHEPSATLQAAMDFENSVEDMLWSGTVNTYTYIDVSKYITRVENGYYYGLGSLKQYDKSGVYYRLISFPPHAWLPTDYKFDPSIQTAKFDPGNLDVATSLDIARFNRLIDHLVTGCTYKPLDYLELIKYGKESDV